MNSDNNLWEVDRDDREGEGRRLDDEAAGIDVEPWDLYGLVKDPFDLCESSLFFQNSTSTNSNTFQNSLPISISGPGALTSSNFFGNNQRKRSNRITVQNETEVSSILCRVARKLDSQQSTAADLGMDDDQYRHSKKIIEIEYGGLEQANLAQFPPSHDAFADQLDDLPELNEKDSHVKKSIVIKPGDMERYYKKVTEAKDHQDEFYQRKMTETRDILPAPSQNQASTSSVTSKSKGPRIPFRARTQEKVFKLAPNPKTESSHQPVLSRREIDSTIVYTQPVSQSMQEWRKQRGNANQAMKMLKKLFPVVSSPPTAAALPNHKQQENKLIFVKVPKPIPAEPLGGRGANVESKKTDEDDGGEAYYASANHKMTDFISSRRQNRALEVEYQEEKISDLLKNLKALSQYVQNQESQLLHQESPVEQGTLVKSTRKSLSKALQVSSNNFQSVILPSRIKVKANSSSNLPKVPALSLSASIRLLSLQK